MTIAVRFRTPLYAAKKGDTQKDLAETHPRDREEIAQHSEKKPPCRDVSEPRDKEEATGSGCGL